MEKSPSKFAYFLSVVLIVIPVVALFILALNLATHRSVNIATVLTYFFVGLLSYYTTDFIIDIMNTQKKGFRWSLYFWSKAIDAIHQPSREIKHLLIYANGVSHKCEKCGRQTFYRVNRKAEGKNPFFNPTWRSATIINVCHNADCALNARPHVRLMGYKKGEVSIMFILKPSEKEAPSYFRCAPDTQINDDDGYVAEY